MQTNGSTALSGTVGLYVVRKDAPTAWPSPPLSLAQILERGTPQAGLSEQVNRWRRSNLWNLWRGLRRVKLAEKLHLPHFYGTLWLTVLRPSGERVDLGLASLRVVTTTGVNFLVDALQNLTEPENLKFHGVGTGAVAEAVGDTALGTELTTAYNPDNTRATGSLTEGAAANVFRSVGTNTVDATAAITEHGILSQAATGGGTLLDRSVFAAVNLSSGDSLQSTYDLTIAAGS